MCDEGGLDDKGAGELGRVGEGEAVHADNEGLRLGFMHQDVVEGGKAAGAGCLCVSGRGVLNSACVEGGGEEVRQRETWNVIGIGSDDDVGKMARERERERGAEKGNDRSEEKKLPEDADGNIDNGRIVAADENIHLIEDAERWSRKDGKPLATSPRWS